MKVTIPKPCHENWEAMTPNEKGRFCQLCSKNVRDFTNSSDMEIIEDLSGESDTCGNFRVDQLNRNLSYSFVNSLLTKFAVGFILTSGGIVTAQTKTEKSYEIKHDTVNHIKGKITEIPIKTLETNPQVRIGGAVSSFDSKTQPLYILDGEIIDDEKFRKINPNHIKKIDILKGVNATSAYGSKGKYGVLVITSKKKMK
ncbi:hypothetical protein OMO38_13835 [Chryseobacterium sp. 09-1422]|uniref:TonB-dependent receptor plug domain-containing protein n=1 Tax=Chryseobacterium kimseyorum TaxID=2984028 RepID=A0ABT3I0P6_9FLAO|nr:hypothetical protein [Chryseobacterium kimseyorum]MCW3169602.1 hypothetical protein [Chryseobacterium kimseyorum]